MALKCIYLKEYFSPYIHPCACTRHKHLCFIKAQSSTELAVAADASHRTITIAICPITKPVSSETSSYNSFDRKYDHCIRLEADLIFPSPSDICSRNNRLSRKYHLFLFPGCSSADKQNYKSSKMLEEDNY